MRIASYNVENLFSRAKALNLETWAEGRDILGEYARLNTLLQNAVYSAADRRAIIQALNALGL
jgi:hypothetical protein